MVAESENNGMAGRNVQSSTNNGYNGNNLGGNTTDNGDGTSTTTDNRGSITHHTDNSSGGSSINWGGGSGKGNAGGRNDSASNNIDLSKYPEAQVSMAMGIPATVGMVDNAWGATLFRSVTVDAALETAIATLKAPFKFTLWGFVIYALKPTEIARDDPRFMARIVLTMPAEKITDVTINDLPLQQATVSVSRRIVYLVKNAAQHLAVINGVKMSIPVVNAKPTKRTGVYTASVVPGLPDFHIKIESGQKPQISRSSITSPEKSNAQYPGYTVGSETHDVIVRFPSGDKQKPVYISVTKVLTPEELKKRQQEEQRRQKLWDEAYPVEALQRKLDAAKKALASADADIKSKKNKLSKLSADLKELAAFANDKLKDFPKPIRKKFKESTEKNIKAKQREYATTEQALATALEARKAKEKKVKDAEDKLKEEKKKPRKGTKDYGHDYHPAPLTKDIKGLGELKESRKKTPKQSGGGLRDRWIGDKGRKIYEWDSQHGELEGYRASNGEHLGSFNPKTGKQLKGPDPKRNIKKYL